MSDLLKEIEDFLEDMHIVAPCETIRRSEELHAKVQAARASEVEPQVMGRVAHLDDGSVICHLNSVGRSLPDHTALYAQPPSPAKGNEWVPEGWKVLPVHATADMIRRGKRAHGEEFLFSQDPDGNIQGIWKAMLAVAPNPPKEGE